MQLDRTQLVVRERSFFDLVDLSFAVMREYFAPLAVTSVLAIAPLWALNILLTDGFLRAHYNEDRPIAVYLWLHLCLVIAEAPLASLLSTMYLGRAVFLDQPTIRSVMWDGWRVAPRWIWCQVFVRGIVWVLILTLASWTTDQGLFGFFQFLMVLALGFVLLIRSLRPFVNEIIVLERNPLLSKGGPNAMTISKRSGILHGPSSGDLFGRAFVSLLLAASLFYATFGAFLFAQGVFLGSWDLTHPLTMRLWYPLSLWMVTCFFTVLRFLNYLDVRIRHEGWEVELRMRAEAARLAKKLQ
jgi:hypothetical protein